MYCKNCGAAMNPNQAICIQCGVKTGEGANFCNNCGKLHSGVWDKVVAPCVVKLFIFVRAR